ncbi:tripartite tricarboxylate transporter substrate-binding protein [Variovorax sp. DT-64]|uniref:tripartite tricarboxylate transporter substrate-binding protein n=1 Tax=Variovorax sp. DT-64 TaxID=3396160 RepID=UPI003F1D3CB1
MRPPLTSVQTGERSTEGMPDVPTLAETVPGYVIDAWYAVWAPAGTPKEVVAKLTEA